MDYYLVGDDCNDCSYVSHALSLLKFPFKNFPILNSSVDAISDTLKTVPDASTVFVCKNIVEKHYNQTVSIVKKNIITWGCHEKHAATQGDIHLLNMPFSQYELTNTLAACANARNSNAELNNPAFQKLVGKSKKIQEIKMMIAQVAASDTTVLILGPSGTGKDIIASCIHQLSDSHSNAFVPVNCGAIPSELMESELFGHEKGAFTGALTKRAGRFEVANNGTLFLDEVGDMPLSMQVKLLRVIQERKIERVGGNHSIDVNVRLIAATHKNLEKMISEEQFREDLFYRLNVFPINVPSLHERKEDIPLIIDYQLEKIFDRLKHRITFTESALELICDYAWPGNIRELQNFLERMVILYPDSVIGEDKIHFSEKAKSKKKGS